jgi:antitoxin MazE
MFIHCLSLPMRTTAQRWGNSLGVRIPAPVARELKIADGSEVDLQIEAGRIVLTPVRRTKSYARQTLIAKITAANGPPADVWGAAVGKEVW